MRRGPPANRYDMLDISNPMETETAIGFAVPVLTTRAAQVKLRPPSHLALGMLRLGAKSGYAIKKATDISTRVFFPTSLAQVYPELARLKKDGLVTRRENPHGGRAGAAYELTDRGEGALLAWVRCG